MTFLKFLLEKVKKEFTYEDDKPKKDFESGGGWDEVKKVKNDQQSMNFKSSQSGAGSSSWNKPEKQDSTGGFSHGFEKFEYSKK